MRPSWTFAIKPQPTPQYGQIVLTVFCIGALMASCQADCRYSATPASAAPNDVPILIGVFSAEGMPSEGTRWCGSLNFFQRIAEWILIGVFTCTRACAWQEVQKA